MAYVQGFVIPVPRGNRAAYSAAAAQSARIFMEYGAARVVETWGDPVPEGKITDFRRAVLAEDSEAVVFSWIEWPDKAICDAAAARMETDPRWAEMGEMPFDTTRLIWSGFQPFLDVSAEGETISD